MSLLFIETKTGDWDNPTLSWVVEATPEEREKIVELLGRRLNPDEHDEPYIGDLTVLTAEEFIEGLDDWFPEEDDDADAAAVPTGD